MRAANSMLDIVTKICIGPVSVRCPLSVCGPILASIFIGFQFWEKCLGVFSGFGGVSWLSYLLRMEAVHEVEDQDLLCFLIPIRQDVFPSCG